LLTPIPDPSLKYISLAGSLTFKWWQTGGISRSKMSWSRAAVGGRANTGNEADNQSWRHCQRSAGINSPPLINRPSPCDWLGI